MATPTELARRADCPPSMVTVSKPQDWGVHGEARLSSLTMRNGAYLTLRYGLGVLVSLGNMLVLTWWIGPHAYGVFVTAIGLSGFLANLSRAGVDTCLIRREPEPNAHVHAVASTLILGNSLILLLAGVAVIPLLNEWYGSRELVAPYLVLLLNVPVIGLAGLPIARLERQLDFGAVAGIELGGQVLAFVISLLLAVQGCGVWAPVGGQLAWQGFVLIAAYRRTHFLPRLGFDVRLTREMLAYGFGITASLRIWQLRGLVNPLLVGRFAGAEGVAFVALAVRIAEGLGTVRLAAGRLAVAALARLQDDQQRLQAALQRALHLQLLSLGPLLCGFALLGPVIVPRVLGVRWLPSLAVYPFVAAGVLVNSLYNLQGSALFVVGRPWVVTRCSLLHVALLAGATLFLLPRVGLAGYGWAELSACTAYIVIHTGLGRIVTVSYRRLAPWLAVFLLGLFLPSVVLSLETRLAASRTDSRPPLMLAR